MKKNGFTMVELLAVITILGVLVAITVPFVMDNVNNTKKKACQQTVDTIKQTTQLYLRDYHDSITGIDIVNNNIAITIQTLVDNENLKTPVFNSFTDEEIPLTTPININVVSLKKYTVTVDAILCE